MAPLLKPTPLLMTIVTLELADPLEGTRIMECLVLVGLLLALEWKVQQAVQPRWALLEPLAVVQLRLLATSED